MKLMLTLSRLLSKIHNTCQTTKWLAKSTINDLPDELLVEIFDFYRQIINAHEHMTYHGCWWASELSWFKLIHVCKRWRAVLSASSSHLDLRIVLLPVDDIHRHLKHAPMKTILSRHFPPFPIKINYDCRCVTSFTATDMGRMRVALKFPNRVREINLSASTADLETFFKAARRLFPALESLTLRHELGEEELKIPATFLKGPNPRLQTLSLDGISLTSISRLLSSATGLTSLSLRILEFGQLPIKSLLTHLQGMPYLGRLGLSIDGSIDHDDPAQPTPEEIIPLSKLKSFKYQGPNVFLNILMAGFAAPSLREVDIEFDDDVSLSQNSHLPRFIEDLPVEDGYHTFQMDFGIYNFCVLLLAPNKYELPRFRLYSRTHSQSSIQVWAMQMSSVVSAKLSTIEELYFTLHDTFTGSEEAIPWRRYLLQFPSLKALRMQGMSNRQIASIASILYQDHGSPTSPVLPALEEIELCMAPDSTESQRTSELAAFQPFVSARQQAGRPVKISSFQLSSWY